MSTAELVHNSLAGAGDRLGSVFGPVIVRHKETIELLGSEVT
jgi:hypothetical protein